MEKPFSPACERNQQPILEVIKPLLADKTRLLEIGTGTGQHAVYMAPHLPHLQWQTADLKENHAGIIAWLQDAGSPNILSPVIFDAEKITLAAKAYDCVYTANTFHIMSWPQVCATISQVGTTLKPNGLLLIYGPFKFNGEHTSKSNQQFDADLIAQASHMGIRDFEDIRRECEQKQLVFHRKYQMPANNFILTFKK